MTQLGQDNDENANGEVTPNLGIGKDIDGPQATPAPEPVITVGSEVGGKQRPQRALKLSTAVSDSTLGAKHGWKSRHTAGNGP